MVHEHFGRVVLASYQPHGQYDPVLPVPLMRLSPEFKEAYRNLANVISAWVNAMFALYYAVQKYNRKVQNCYAYAAPPKPEPVIMENYTMQINRHGTRAIYWAKQSDKWTAEEWQYFHSQMRLSMARPERFTDYDNEHIRAIWQKAVAYNISLIT